MDRRSFIASAIAALVAPKLPALPAPATVYTFGNVAGTFNTPVGSWSHLGPEDIERDMAALYRLSWISRKVDESDAELRARYYASVARQPAVTNWKKAGA